MAPSKMSIRQDVFWSTGEFLTRHLIIRGVLLEHQASGRGREFSLPEHPGPLFSLFPCWCASVLSRLFHQVSLSELRMRRSSVEGTCTLGIRAGISRQVDRSKWRAETKGRRGPGRNLQPRMDTQKPFAEVRDCRALAEQHIANWSRFCDMLNSKAISLS